MFVVLTRKVGHRSACGRSALIENVRGSKVLANRMPRRRRLAVGVGGRDRAGLALPACGASLRRSHTAAKPVMHTWGRCGQLIRSTSARGVPGRRLIGRIL